MFNTITNTITNRKARSAWEKGVKLYALELVENMREYTIGMGRAPKNETETRLWMLSGAENWKEFSHGGCALIYDGEIAERLCTPSELRKKDGGRLAPNRAESWIDVQARALYQASRLVAWAWRDACKTRGTVIE